MTAGSPAPPPAPPPPPPAPPPARPNWRRRGTAAFLHVASVGLLLAWFFLVRPDANIAETNVDLAVAAVKQGRTGGDVAAALETSFRAYRRETGLGAAVLVAGLLAGALSVWVDLVWGLVDRFRGGGSAAPPAAG